MSLLLKDIIAKIKPDQFVGNPDAPVSSVRQLSDWDSKDALFWCSDKNAAKLRELKGGSVILSSEALKGLQGEAKNIPFNCIVTEHPRRYFMEVVKDFFAPKQVFSVAKSSVIHATVKMHLDKVFIGENVVIESDVKIGENVFIGHNSVILQGTVIGNNVRIGSNCTIGGIGFGYEKDANGHYEQIIHIGNVELKDNVEIGNNVAIDRAVMGSTLLGKNVKVDNLVHIAHGVTIGENSLVIAHAMIAGSVNIGKNVWVAPSSSVLQKLNVGDDAVIGMASNVLKDVEQGSVVAGNPAKKIR